MSNNEFDQIIRIAGLSILTSTENMFMAIKIVDLNGETIAIPLHPDTAGDLGGWLAEHARQLSEKHGTAVGA